MGADLRVTRNNIGKVLQYMGSVFHLHWGVNQKNVQVLKEVVRPINLKQGRRSKGDSLDD